MPNVAISSFELSTVHEVVAEAERQAKELPTGT